MKKEKCGKIYFLCHHLETEDAVFHFPQINIWNAFQHSTISQLNVVHVKYILQDGDVVLL